MFRFALVYSCLVITTLIFCAVVFGLALKSASNELVANKIGQENQPSISNLISLCAIFNSCIYFKAFVKALNIFLTFLNRKGWHSC